jgi:hypothetical protein
MRRQPIDRRMKPRILAMRGEQPKVALAFLNEGQ